MPSSFHPREHFGITLITLELLPVSQRGYIDEQLKVSAKLPSCLEREKCVILILDEMHLREDLSYDKHTGKALYS